jgi:acetylornithine deacetylase
VIWVDSADSQPCIGTAGAMQWHLKTTGKLFHSGLPHKGINPIEMGMEALAIIQSRFYSDYPAHPDEKKWNFDTASTMKPTQIECARGRYVIEILHISVYIQSMFSVKSFAKLTCSTVRPR